ncbi:MAG: 1-(5-phosphoribosyl)-5-[(5-phosphoribosylamino)methylideneamino] imidazole-4-carboxamide isomerase [Acidobacteria bacterium]|nr:1-(5-phosphoribosyl)-5-[(5-phosphoribosylamino)methylideneamino] imidazole-4-carboxamide isomerase [Acidobacteriota bacterium]MBS1864827.1 1-(5-phosphoribosyl)-5-[(5-phosphoribosylamino)methylideneamino] imidazole-4-carboxamide isomerase [Acidobacteriota bacterium]
MLIPCIDLQNGQAVQLVHGRKRELAVADVFGLLERFKEYAWLHVIDLDAAMRKGDNNALAEELCKRAKSKYKMKVRVGGGIRTVARAQRLVKLGAAQVIVGSAAFTDGKIDSRFLRGLAKTISKKRVVIALDTWRGKITVQGWRKTLSLQPQDVMARLAPFCEAFLCTDVDREGTMGGANMKWFESLREATKHPVVAAGGIKTRREIQALEKLGMDAAVGMAVYKNRLR